MPEINEIRKGIEIGRNDLHKFIWSKCELCDRYRWVPLRNNKPESPICKHHQRNPNCSLNLPHKRTVTKILTSDQAKVGDLVNGDCINRSPTCIYIKCECPQCHSLEWKQWNRWKSNQSNELCRDCKVINKAIKGIRHKGPHGYMMVKLLNTDFYYPMADKAGYVKEHRLVLARHIGRCLWAWEVVHHKNGIRDDNRLENLELTSSSFHHKEHNQGYQDGYRKGLIDGHNKQIEELKVQNETLIREIRLLQLQIKERI